MRKTASVTILASFLATGILLLSCNDSTKTPEPTSTGSISKDSMIKRGSYLVSLMGCDDCHSPKIMGPHGPEVDMSKRLSGHPAQMPIGKYDQETLKSWVLFGPMTTATVGPWGTSFAANITSSQMGIGSWTEAQFFKAIREGKSKGIDGNRMMLPPMPWPNIAKASDDDLKAIFAFLKSTTPVDNAVPMPIPPGHH